MKELWLLAAACLVAVSYSQEPNWKNVPYETQVSYTKCWTDQYRSCTWILFWASCSWRSVQQCAVDFMTVTKVMRMCKDGWTNLPDCQTPICTSCRSGEICTKPNQCSCLTTGGACTNVPCDESKSCYPGTCLDNKCLCNENFYGDDCQYIRKTPTLTCEATIRTNFDELKSTCASSTHESDIKWINSVNKITARYGATFRNDFNLPDSNAASYVRFPTHFGISSIGIVLTLKSQRGMKRSEAGYTCGGYSSKDPYSSATCDFVKSYSETGLPQPLLNDTLQIEFYSTLGGNVEGNNNPKITFSSFPMKSYFGNATRRSTEFKFDNEPPVHCLNRPNDECPIFPIYLENDITTNQIIQPKFLGWADSASGIARYHVEVYLLRSGLKKTLENSGQPLIIIDTKSTDNAVAFSTSESGVYSIELTVYDQANNSASARNIFVFSKDAIIKTNPENPLKVSHAVKDVGNNSEWWITNAKQMVSREIIISWEGYCTSDGKFNDEWTLPVEPWAKGIDDKSSVTYNYGTRTIEKLDALQGGIHSYTISYFIDSQIKGYFNESGTFNSSTKSAKIQYENLKDGITIGVQFSCADMKGGKITEVLYINVDTSPPVALNSTFIKNYPDIYSSSFKVFIEDKDSGIKSINYKIVDDTLNITLLSNSISPKIRDFPGINKKNRKREVLEGPCTDNDITCYCTPMGQCYNYYQSVEIDHCLIDRLNINYMSVRITITNMAGISSTEKTIKMGDIKQLECRPKNKLTSGEIAAIVICVLLVFAVLVITTILLIRIYHLKKPPPRILTNAILKFRRNEEPRDTPNPLYTSAVYEAPSKDTSCYTYNDYNKEGYVYTSGEYSGLRKLPESSITLCEVLNKSKTTIVNKAKLNENGVTKTVAVKYLKNGSSCDSKIFLEQKITFLGGVTPHENIVKFFGVCARPQGPIMVMEYCETALKCWLSEIGEITPEIADDMTFIALNVAKGVEHLHKRKIIHKRLLAKNVLLTKSFSQYVPKLIGFSPDETSDNKASVPMKWLAPETLETIKKLKPFYDKKTDAWTFGILLWEIFTKATFPPYPELNSNEVSKVIISGQKMSMPNDCPTVIFDRVMNNCWNSHPEDRPSFAEIISELELYHNSGPQSTGYYIPE